ncbi:unnamed protein product [Dibothriocephalus latus]|uniref:Rho-GAP domain-containing protein n=1 Tax=Dibothriocephalus latus TaxID=60516 RepID=A0A3P7NX54_DIBLA|nr:unnamed protein product [Dibothriocephalus latus]
MDILTYSVTAASQLPQFAFFIHSFRLYFTTGEPPDFSSLNEPGPVFGAPLDSQIQSPDHPGVPLMLDALVQAVQTHGLYHVGLYRAPGRQKEVSRFVCLANLVSPPSRSLLLHTHP